MDPSAVAAAKDCKTDAYGLLAGSDLPVARVIDAQVDAILWVDEDGRPKTTFVTVHSKDGALTRELDTHDGFVASSDVDEA